jgi:membrane fusion protein
MLNDKSKLFRKEAISFKDRNLEGRAIITSPSSFKFLTILLLFFIVIFVLLTTTATYSRQELVIGRLVPEGEFSKLVALKSGTVKTLSVKEGQYVEKGELLIAVESPYFDQKGQNVNSEIASQFDDTLTLLDKSFVLEQSLSARLHRKLASDISVKTQEKIVTTKLIDTQTQKVNIIRNELDSFQRLSKQGQLSESQFQVKQKEYLDEKIVLQRLELQQQSLESTLIQLSYEESTITQKIDIQAQRINLEKASIKRSIYDQETRGGYQIRAPISGVVSGLVVKSGEQVVEDAPLLTITNKNSKLEAELFVPTKAVGFISEQSDVRMRYVAFPYQKFGSYSGKIKSISKTILFPREHESRSGINKPVYQVVVELSQQHIEYNTVRQTLQPGMEVQAYLMGEKRSLLEWLFEPLLAFDRNFWP